LLIVASALLSVANLILATEKSLKAHNGAALLTRVLSQSAANEPCRAQLETLSAPQGRRSWGSS
jgi:hypothetical protein